MKDVYIRRLRKLTIRRNRGTPIRCRVCHVQWEPGQLEAHYEDCPILKLSVEWAVDSGSSAPLPKAHKRGAVPDAS